LGKELDESFHVHRQVKCRLTAFDEITKESSTEETKEKSKENSVTFDLESSHPKMRVTISSKSTRLTEKKTGSQRWNRMLS
jgi:hypothetical protein